MKHLEDSIQMAYVAHARQLFPWVGNEETGYLLYHVPNKRQTTPQAGKRWKALGVQAGIPDINVDIPVASYNGLRIEFKKDAKQRPRQQQKSIHELLLANGYEVKVCWTVLDALIATADYFSSHLNPDISSQSFRILQSLMKA